MPQGDAYQNNGCDGGMPSAAFAFAADNMQVGSTTTLRQYGVDTDTNYPYRARVRVVLQL
jgi:hypothetical protein